MFYKENDPEKDSDPDITEIEQVKQIILRSAKG